jgi:hypothetical protein
MQEFLAYLKAKFGQVYAEVNYAEIMPTKRKFRADFMVNPNILIEVNGGQFVNGRHNRGGKGYERDLEKGNLAQKCGYKFYQFTYEMLAKQEYLNVL